MASTNEEREIERLQYQIRAAREETYIGRLVWGIIFTVLGVSTGLTCMIVLATISPYKGLLDVKSTQGWSAFILIVSIVVTIAGIALIRSFVNARAERTSSINYMTDQIENLRRKAAQTQIREKASAAKQASELTDIADTALSRAVNLSNGRWRCVCGREHESYVGTCACGRTRAGINKAKAEARKRRQEQADAEKRQKEQEAEEKRLKEEQKQETQTINFAALRELKGLLDDGIITQEEFDRKKKVYLGDASETESSINTNAAPAAQLTAASMPAAQVSPVIQSSPVMQASPVLQQASAVQQAAAPTPAAVSAPAAVSEPEPPKMRVCPNCGSTCSSEAVFCKNCGCRM